MGLTLDDLKKREPKIDFEHLTKEEILRYRMMDFSSADTEKLVKRAEKLGMMDRK